MYRSLSTRSNHHEQESCESRTEPIPLRTPDPPREPTDPTPSSIPNASLPFRIPFQHVLRRDSTEWSHCSRTVEEERGFPLASTDDSHVLSSEFGSGRDLVEWYFILESVRVDSLCISFNKRSLILRDQLLQYGSIQR